MVQEAEKFRHEDEQNAARIQAKNSLENYYYSLKNSLNDEKLAGKIEESDKKTVMDKIEETIKWLTITRSRRRRSTRPSRRRSRASPASCRRSTAGLPVSWWRAGRPGGAGR